MKVYFKKTLAVLLCFLLSSPAYSKIKFWHKVIQAIIYVESRGDTLAINGKHVGPMQISPICVEDCNRILKQNKSKVSYTLKDRYNLKKSKEMFCIIQNEYNPECNIEKAIRIWNGGPTYSIESTNDYYLKVKNRL